MTSGTFFKRWTYSSIPWIRIKSTIFIDWNAFAIEWIINFRDSIFIEVKFHLVLLWMTKKKIPISLIQYLPLKIGRREIGKWVGLFRTSHSRRGKAITRCEYVNCIWPLWTFDAIVNDRVTRPFSSTQTHNTFWGFEIGKGRDHG